MLPNEDQDTVQQTAATAMEIPEFVVGKAYNRRKEITGKFGGSGQSGIAPSRLSPAVFLFTGTGEQHGYKDEFDEFGHLLYVGEGQLGNMKMSKGNLAIASHAKDGFAARDGGERGPASIPLRTSPRGNRGTGDLTA